MANLKFPIGSLEIILTAQSPLQKNQRFNADLDLTINWLASRIKLENKNGILLTRQDVDRLISMLKTFIQSRVNVDERNDREDRLSTPTFTPMELGFSISCLDGDVDDELVGEVTLKIMLNSDVVNYMYTSNYVGVEVNVNSTDIFKFCDMLEMEMLS